MGAGVELTALASETATTLPLYKEEAVYSTYQHDSNQNSDNDDCK